MKKELVFVYVRVGIAVGILLLLLGGFLYHLTSSAVGEKYASEDQVRQWVKDRTGIAQIDEISEFRGTKVYAVVIGKNHFGTPVIAWLTPDSVDFEIMDGVVTRNSVQEAVLKGDKNARILHIVPGKDDNQKFWEAVYIDQEQRYNYVYYDFKTGKVLKSYRLNPVS
ncbi:DUF5590 domain-containing protein [Brevibacillus sp. SYSU BS000544]|uniref:cell wall elongation regulator TseB-like domain-containing protein n=1 Tax=Brevibacillus sp. SYSU BS000544 TaxID=3416443 RepID=UPI003CE4B6BE